VRFVDMPSFALLVRRLPAAAEGMPGAGAIPARLDDATVRELQPPAEQVSVRVSVPRCGLAELKSLV
jgi:hypothetical protein